MNPKTPPRRILFLSIALGASILLGGCATTATPERFIYSSGGTPLEKGAAVALVVQSSPIAGDVEAYLTSSLRAHGYRVIEVDSMRYLSPGMRNFLFPRGAFSFPALMLAEKDAKLAGKTELFEKLMPLNEVKDGAMRYNDLYDFVTDVGNKHKIDYWLMLSLVAGSDHRYQCRAVKASTREIVYSYYSTVDWDGLDRNFPRITDSGKWRRATASTEKDPSVI
ncbi:MAG: hypothetical protein J0L75_19495, partial [Spirochaetes bacterium]|nr:hypothetical protein [Spirochaetota bacterium]